MPSKKSRATVARPKAGMKAPEKDKISWKRLLSELLAGAAHRIKSQALAEETTKALRKAGEVRNVSLPLVEKWRSPKSGVVPTSLATASALAEALEVLGVFSLRDVPTPPGARAQLFELLGFQPARTPRGLVSEVFHETLEEMTTKVLVPRSPDPRDAPHLSDWDQLTAAACLVSQHAVKKADEGLASRPARGKLILLISLELSAKPEAQEAFKRSAAELMSAKTQEHLEPLLASGVEGHVVFSLVPMAPETPDDSVWRNLCDLRDALVKRFPSIQLWVLESPPSIVGRDGFWLHLYDDQDSCAVWRMVRHQVLFQETQASPASTFCSPLSDAEARSLVGTLGIAFGTTKKRWTVGSKYLRRFDKKYGLPASISGR